MASTVDRSNAEESLIAELRSQLDHLSKQVEELQRENERLLTRLSSCQCSEVKEAASSYDSANSEGTCPSTMQGCTKAEANSSTLKCYSLFEISNEKKKPSNQMRHQLTKQPGVENIIQDCDQRYVALKIMYFGQRFYGFASQAQMEPTIESEIFKALERTKLLVGSRIHSHYSRCGRTDKGVSATGQVISLYLRSNKKGIQREEINYAMVLNRVLPKDIRVLGWSSVPLDFTARFSCLSREYRYLFWRGNMDISVMREAANKFKGEHDYRNFCKMDAVNVKNFRRYITGITISPCNKRFDVDLWAITITGSAFLWHQVRCMVSVLFMIGEGLESPNIIDVLLDINKTPRKPQYNMASELPLMLCRCEFQDVNFICSSDVRQNLQEHLTNELRGYLLQAAIVEEALDCLKTSDAEESSLGHYKKKKGHISLELRQTEPSYEERSAKCTMKATNERSDVH